ncbi:MAG: hypothetical protein QXM85_00360, partial [Candidatus Aenigmatarchaeota archaeon]
IDVENYYKKEEYKQLHKIFKNQPLILIDPTDRNRNTTAPVTVESFLRFRKLAREFLKKPSERFFSEKKSQPITIRELNRILSQRKTDLILVKFTPPKVVPDILWPQLRRFGERLKEILEETKYEFRVLRSGVYSNGKDLAIVLLEMEVNKLPHVQKRVGPSVFDINDSARFLKKYSKPLVGPFVEGINWVVEVKRKFITAHEKLVDTLNKSSDILRAKGIPNYIADQLVKGFNVISENKKILKLVQKDKEFGVFLRNYFQKEKLSY